MRDEVEEYINSVPAERQERFRRIVEVIGRDVPQAERTIEHKMPMFRSGADSIAVANRKNYISIYACADDKLQAFRRKYPKIKTGVSCINIKDSDDFDPEDVREVTKAIFG